MFTMRTWRNHTRYLLKKRYRIVIVGLAWYILFDIRILFYSSSKHAQVRHHKAYDLWSRWRAWLQKQLPIPYGCGIHGVHFSSQPLPLTALASYPGSGNTWVRHLIQQATGVLTGSIYIDKALRAHGFPADGVNNRSCVVVKSHSSNWHHIRAFNRAVLIYRDPGATILSEFNRQNAGHLGRASEDHFIYGRKWSRFVRFESTRWLQFYEEWLQFPGPLYLLRYGDLQKDLRSSLLGVTNFLGFKITKDHLKCVITNAEGTFHRGNSSFDQQAEYFTDKMNLNLRELQLRFEVMLNRLKARRKL